MQLGIVGLCGTLKVLVVLTLCGIVEVTLLFPKQAHNQNAYEFPENDIVETELPYQPAS